MKLLRKFSTETLLIIGLIASYFILRLTHVMSLPLFTDEAIYVRWSQIAKQDAAWRFISLTDGKQPMFVWWNMVFMKFIHDPLLAGRLVSVASGLLTMIGLFFLGRELFKNKWIGFLSAALYILFPFALVYDRMALYDTMTGMFAVWTLYFQILLVRKPRAWVAFTLALIMGGGMLTKTSIFLLEYLMPLTLVLFDWSKKDVRRRLGEWAFFALIAVGLANLYYSILRLSPFFHVISEKDAVFVYPVREWLKHPFTFFVGNLRGLWDWFSGYVTYPMIALIIASFLVIKQKLFEKLLMVAIFLLPFMALALFGKVLYPRYILFMTLPLLPLIALPFYSLFQWSRLKGGIIALLFVVLWLRADYYIITNFAVAPIPQSDLTQYSNDWPAGGGVAQIISYLKGQSKDHTIFVASEGTFGSLPTYAVEIYFNNNDHVLKRGVWPVDTDMPLDIATKSAEFPSFMIFNQTQLPPTGWPVSLIAKYQKGTGNSYISLYKIIPQKQYENKPAK